MFGTNDNVRFDITIERDGEIYVLKQQHGVIVGPAIIEGKHHVHWYAGNKVVSISEHTMTKM